MENEKIFKVIEVKECKTTDGRTFTAYKVSAKGGRKMDVRFVKDCMNKPTEPCNIVVAENDANVDTTRQYPILWVKNVIRCEPFERKSNVNEFFD